MIDMSISDESNQQNFDINILQSAIKTMNDQIYFQNDKITKLTSYITDQEQSINLLKSQASENEKKFNSDIMAYSSQIKLDLTTLINQTQNMILEKLKSEFKDANIKADLDKQDKNIMINKLNSSHDQLKIDAQQYVNDKLDTVNLNLKKLNEHAAINFSDLNSKFNSLKIELENVNNSSKLI